MKTLLLTGLSIIIIMIMSWSPSEPYEKYDNLVMESETLTDSALVYLKELHEHNDSLLDKYFPKETSQTSQTSQAK